MFVSHTYDWDACLQAGAAGFPKMAREAKESCDVATYSGDVKDLATAGVTIEGLLAACLAEVRQALPSWQ